MIKRYTKITIISILSLVIAIELGYIINNNVLKNNINDVVVATPTPLPVVGGDKVEQPTGEARIIVIDPGHGKPSSYMTDSEKLESGWVRNSSGQWGEWRHYKTGTVNTDCEGSGCSGRVTPNGACWYPIENSDRNTEPDINLRNALSAQQHLENMGYTVRLTRTSNDENPSIAKRLSYCYPDNDTTKEPEAELFISIHSNAVGGSANGSAYISTRGVYDQKWIDRDYVKDSNTLGKLCNDYIVEMTSLNLYNSGEITWEPELIAFCKSPVPCGYLEIGFFDNSSDLDIINAEFNNIGMAIAKGVDEFCKTH